MYSGKKQIATRTKKHEEEEDNAIRSTGVKAPSPGNFGRASLVQVRILLPRVCTKRGQYITGCDQTSSIYELPMEALVTGPGPGSALFLGSV